MISGLVRSGTKTILLAGDGDDLEQVKGINYNYRCIRYTSSHDDSTDFHKIIAAVYVRKFKNSFAVLLCSILL